MLIRLCITNYFVVSFFFLLIFAISAEYYLIPACSSFHFQNTNVECRIGFTVNTIFRLQIQTQQNINWIFSGWCWDISQGSLRFRKNRRMANSEHRILKLPCTNVPNQLLLFVLLTMVNFLSDQCPRNGSKPLISSTDFLRWITPQCGCHFPMLFVTRKAFVKYMHRL